MHLVSRRLFLTIFIQFLTFLSFWSYAQSSCIPVVLKCENLVSSLGIDASNPRLSWRLDDKRNGAIQTAYQLFIGTDSLTVSKANGNIWQTVKVNSSMQTVKYNGKTSLPFTKYFRISVMGLADKKRGDYSI